MPESCEATLTSAAGKYQHKEGGLIVLFLGEKLQNTPCGTAMEEERHPAAVYSAHHSHPCVHCLGDVISPSQGRKNLPCTPKLRIPQSLVISWIAIQGLSKYFPLKRNTILSFLAEHKISDSTAYAMSCSQSVLHYYQSQSQGNSWSREQKPCI